MEIGNCVITWVFFYGQWEPSAFLDFLKMVLWLVLIFGVYNSELSWCRQCYQLKGLSEIEQHYREFYLLCKQNTNSIKHRSYERLTFTWAVWNCILHQFYVSRWSHEIIEQKALYLSAFVCDSSCDLTQRLMKILLRYCGSLDEPVEI